MTREELQQLRGEYSKTYKVKDLVSNRTVRICISPKCSEVFLFNKGSRRYGRYLNEEDALRRFELTLEQTNPTEVWHKRLSKAVRMLDKSGLYPELKTMYINLLSMSYEDHQALSLAWNDELSKRPNSDKQRLQKLYPFAFVSDGAIDTNYINELSDCQIKTMYFGKWGQALKNMAKESVEKAQKEFFKFDDGSYDCYFSHNPNGSSVYAQEYRGTGNGHYYLVLDGTHCVFYEND